MLTLALAQVALSISVDMPGWISVS